MFFNFRNRADRPKFRPDLLTRSSKGTVSRPDISQSRIVDSNSFPGPEAPIGLAYSAKLVSHGKAVLAAQYQGGTSDRIRHQAHAFGEHDAELIQPIVADLVRRPQDSKVNGCGSDPKILLSR